jgi:hypothetical protein
MQKFLIWINKIGYEKAEVYSDANLLKILLDEFANLELFHIEYVEKFRK